MAPHTRGMEVKMQHNSRKKTTKKHKEWLTTETWVLIAERKRVKNQINQIQDPEE